MPFTQVQSQILPFQFNFVDDESYQQIKKFFVDTHNTFMNNDFIKKEILLEDLPNYLNKKGTTKANFIAKLPNEVTEAMFIELLMMQTEGYEYPTFEYFILKYKLKFDDNHMIIFTDQFPFDKRIKKEALFIWGILNYIRNDPFLGQFKNLIEFECQTKIGSNYVLAKSKMYDLCFPKLRIVVEIDENHQDANNNYRTTELKTNDTLKNAIIRQHGLNMARLNFQAIYEFKREIPNGINVNKYINNSEIYAMFLKDLSEMLKGSLMKEHYMVRKEFNKFEYRNTLDQQMEIIDSELAGLQLRDKSVITDKKIDIKMTYKGSLQLLINGLESSEFITLFELKDKSKKANGRNVINFTDIKRLMKDINDDVEDFTLFLCYNNMMDNEDNIESIRVSWKQLCKIIIHYGKKNSLRDLLIAYYLEVEDTYEKIIALMNKYTDQIIGDGMAFSLCFERINDVYENKLEVELTRKTEALKIDLVKRECAMEVALNKKFRARAKQLEEYHDRSSNAKFGFGTDVWDRAYKTGPHTEPEPEPEVESEFEPESGSESESNSELDD